MAESGNGNSKDPATLRDFIGWLALAGVFGTGYHSVSSTEDRYTSREAAIVNANVERRLVELSERVDGHLATHPDRGLQVQINELRQDLIRLEAKIENQIHTHSAGN